MNSSEAPMASRRSRIWLLAGALPLAGLLFLYLDPSAFHPTASDPVRSIPITESTRIVRSPSLRRRLEEVSSVKRHFGLIFPKTEQMPFYLRNTFEPAPESFDERDIVFFFHIPKTGGELVKYIMGNCYGLKRAQKVAHPASLELVSDFVVNVDTNSPDGIVEAHGLKLVDSNTVDFISSRYVLSASSLFTARHNGRAFTIMRHPIDLAASNFQTRRKKNKELHTMTLAEYAAKDYYVDNWVTRQLTGTVPEEKLTRHHVESAKHILTAKYFVGIYEQMDETVRQLKAFYGWKTLPEQGAGCAKDLTGGKNPKFVKTEHPMPARGSEDWKTIASVEQWDMELYYLALDMFSKQGMIWDAQGYSLVG